MSYRRLRAGEVTDLGRRLRARGIPLWIDISDLGPGSTEEQISEALEDHRCASAVAWITAEVAHSAVIRRVEVPGIVRRVKRKDGFFGVFVAAGGLTYSEAASVAADNLGVTDLAFWNQHKVNGDPGPPEELADVADRVLRLRLQAIAASTTAAEPVRIGIWVRRPPPADTGNDLDVDWSDSFSGRRANLGTWDAELLPAVATIHREVATRTPGRLVSLSGYPTIAAAVALGRAFPAVAGVSVTWQQLAEDGSYADWALSTPAEVSGYTVRTTAIDPAGSGLAVLVSVMHDAALAFRASEGLPAMRAALELIPVTEGRRPRLTPGAARQLATELVDAIRRARERYLGIEDIHLFLAAPVGLAFMLGQLLNAVGPVTVYEHFDQTALGYYRPEVRLAID